MFMGWCALTGLRQTLGMSTPQHLFIDTLQLLTSIEHSIRPASKQDWSSSRGSTIDCRFQGQKSAMVVVTAAGRHGVLVYLALCQCNNDLILRGPGYQVHT